MNFVVDQLRVSAVLTNGAYVLNLDYDHYVNNSRALREAMCFLMDPVAGNRTCFVQFPLRRAVADADDADRFVSRDSVFFDVRTEFASLAHPLIRFICSINHAN